MDAELSNLVEGVPERFDPVGMRGQLTEAEHLTRYAWACGAVAGRRVLDAGCGLAYGSVALARAGAAEVIGVDIAAPVVEAAREAAGQGVDLRVGDVAALDFPDGRFDVVVCFEVIEHVDDRDRVLDELKRVLAPDGVLLVSSPNRDAYVPGNPHHIHEYAPDELRDALSARFAHAELRRQHGWIVSAVLDDRTFAAEHVDVVEDLRVGKAIGVTPGEETYTVAVASDGALPALAPAAVMTGTIEVRHWVELFDEQRAALQRQHDHLENLRDAGAERDRLRDQLEASERETARIVMLEQERDEAVGRAAQREAEIRDWITTVERLNREIEEREERLRYVLGSRSWRYTRPLRSVKHGRG